MLPISKNPSGGYNKESQLKQLYLDSAAELTTPTLASNTTSTKVSKQSTPSVSAIEDSVMPLGVMQQKRLMGAAEVYGTG